MTLVEVVAAVALLGVLSLAAAFLAGTASRIAAEGKLRAGALAAAESAAVRLRADLSDGVSVPAFRSYREPSGPGSLTVTVRRTAAPAWTGGLPLPLSYWQVTASWAYVGTPGLFGGGGGDVNLNLVLSSRLERFRGTDGSKRDRGEGG